MCALAIIMCYLRSDWMCMKKRRDCCWTLVKVKESMPMGAVIPQNHLLGRRGMFIMLCAYLSPHRQTRHFPSKTLTWILPSRSIIVSTLHCLPIPDTIVRGSQQQVPCRGTSVFVLIDYCKHPTTGTLSW